MSNDTMPARIFAEIDGGEPFWWTHSKDPITKYIRADLVLALVDAAMGQIETGGCVREILSAVDAIRESE